jgi:hypothetical protein
MPIDENNVPAAQCDADSDMPPFSASDAPPYRLTLDGHCAAAHLVGAAVQYDDGSGFVFCEVES